jgi:hypothetical protein
MNRWVALLLIPYLLLVQGISVHRCTTGMPSQVNPHVHLSSLAAWLGFSHQDDHEEESEESTPHDDSDAVALPDGIVHASMANHVKVCDNSTSSTAAPVQLNLAAPLFELRSSCTLFMDCSEPKGERCAHLSARLVI